MVSYDRLKRASKMREWLKKLAYASLVLDVAISLASIASLKVYSATTILFYLDLALTAEVVIAVILFVAFVALLHYDRAIEGFALMYLKIKRFSYKKKERQPR